MLSFALDLLGALVAPERCAACDARVVPRTVFCPACAATALLDRTRVGPGAASAHAPFLYGGSIATAISRFKYQGRADLARPLSHLLLRAAPRLRPLGVDAVVPIPLHRARLVERGFNQAALLARPLARRLGASFEPRALMREVATEVQASLDRTARQDNVRGAFAARGGALAGRCVLLVDDVTTTGATLAAATHAVQRAGAARVHAVVLARA